jgi:colicin import membrane protein
MTIQETYYVDIVHLPVSAPQTGLSMQKSGDANMPSQPAPVPTPSMTVPHPPKVTQKTTQKLTRPTKPANAQESAETESAFAERMEKLEKNNEAKREEAVLEKLRNKVTAGNSKVGAPTANGAEAGARYTDYIKARLEDALKLTSSYTSKNPEIAVRLTIATDGRISKMKIERSSGDATFELAVRRAIDLASEKFTAPPNHTVFENGFVFKPKGITKSTTR